MNQYHQTYTTPEDSSPEDLTRLFEERLGLRPVAARVPEDWAAHEVELQNRWNARNLTITVGQFGKRKFS